MRTWTILLIGLFALLLVACGGTANTAVSNPEPAAANANSDPAAVADDESTMAEDDTMMEESDEMAADDTMMEDKDEMAEDDAMMEEGEAVEHEDAMMEEAESMNEEEEMAAEDGEMEEADAMDETASRPAWQQIVLTDVRSGETFALADFAGKTVFVEPMATWCSNCRRQLTNVGEARALLDNDDVIFVALSVETTISDADLAAYTESTGFDWTFAVGTPELLQALANEFGQTVLNPPATPHFIIRADGSTTDLVTGIEPADEIVAQIAAVQ